MNPSVFSATRKLCSATRQSCNGPCPGYGTLESCPPLIVIATLAAEQVKHAAEAAR